MKANLQCGPYGHCEIDQDKAIARIVILRIDKTEKKKFVCIYTRAASSPNGDADYNFTEELKLHAGRVKHAPVPARESETNKRDVLRAINAFWAANSHPPTHEQLLPMTKLKSISSISTIIKQLVASGELEKLDRSTVAPAWVMQSITAASQKKMKAIERTSPEQPLIAEPLPEEMKAKS